MLNYFIGIQKEIIGTEDLNSVYGGTMIEHIVGQELLARQYSALNGLNFWVREKNTAVAEIDYLYQYNGQLIPVEVKSGSNGRLRSLYLFMDMTPHHMAVRFYAGELHISVIISPEQKTFYLLNLPYFLVSQIENYLPWFEEEIKKITGGQTKIEV